MVTSQIRRVVEAIDSFSVSLAESGQFGDISIETNEAKDLALVSFPLTAAPDSPAAYDSIELLRDNLVPQAFDEVSSEVYVSGATAVNVDFAEMSDTYMPIVFAFVLGLSFVLLTIAFRSIIVPAKAIVMNLLSVGAAYGAIVLVFQKGYGHICSASSRPRRSNRGCRSSCSACSSA